MRFYVKMVDVISDDWRLDFTMTIAMKYNEEIVKTIVQAINRAISVDIPVAYSENRRATHNCFGPMRVDVINDDLELMLTQDGVKVHHFKRHNWETVMILDTNTSTAFFVFSERNLQNIPKKKDRSCPHYLQSCLHVFHEGYDGKYVQQSFLPIIDEFDDQTYEDDAEMILNNVIDNLSDWHLYAIAYDYSGIELTKVMLYFLSPRFEEIDKKDLGEFIMPNYAAAVKPVDESSPAPTQDETDEPLIKVKAKARPTSEVDADPQVKPNEYDDVG